MYTNDVFCPGDMVQIFIKEIKSKPGKWTSPRKVIKIDTEAGSETLPGIYGRNLCAAVEDVLIRDMRFN